MSATRFGINILFGIPKSRTVRYDCFPEGVVKQDFSNDDFAKVHLHMPCGSVRTYLVTCEEVDDVAVIKPSVVLQELAISLDMLTERIVQWGEDRNIIGNHAKATLLTQLAKTQEELDETIEAAVVYADAILTAKAAGASGVSDTASLDALHVEIVDGIGDQFVTLVLAAELAGVSLSHCVNHAYNVIKNRKGKMVDGQFIKEQ